MVSRNRKTMVALCPRISGPSSHGDGGPRWLCGGSFIRMMLFKQGTGVLGSISYGPVFFLKSFGHGFMLVVAWVLHV